MSMCEKVKGNAGPPLLQEEKTGEEETMHVCVCAVLIELMAPIYLTVLSVVMCACVI